MLTEKLLDVNQHLDIRHTLLHLSRNIVITFSDLLMNIQWLSSFSSQMKH